MGAQRRARTTLAHALGEMVQATANRPVLRASIDDFHCPGHKFRSMWSRGRRLGQHHVFELSTAPHDLA